jgi:hexokinase
VPYIVSQSEATLPALETKNQLFEILLQEIDSRVTVVSINFAFPLDAHIRDNRLDGKLIKGTKSHILHGLVGRNFGQELERYIFEKTKRTISVTVANDALCLLLSAIHRNTNDNLMGGIVGTGTNYAIFHKGNVYNLESGNFDKFTMTATGNMIDKNSNNPGQQHFEKEVAGGYLYQHYNTFVEMQNLPIKTLRSTLQLSYLAESSNPSLEQKISRRLLERSARLTGAKLAALLDFKSQPFTSIIMEGSLFWEGWNYVKTVEDTIEKLGHKLNTFEWIHIPDSSVIGASNLVQTVNP